MGWLGLHVQNSETDHDCLIGDRFTTWLLIASEFYVHGIASLLYRIRWRGEEG